MADPSSLEEIAKIGGPALIGAGGVGAFMRWLQGKEAETVTTKLALMEQKLDTLVTNAARTDSMREDVALLKQTVKALHDRVDRVERDEDEPTTRRRK